MQCLYIDMITNDVFFESFKLYEQISRIEEMIKKRKEKNTISYSKYI